MAGSGISRAVEHTGEDGGPIEVDNNIQIEFIEPEKQDGD